MAKPTQKPQKKKRPWGFILFLSLVAIGADFYVFLRRPADVEIRGVNAFVASDQWRIPDTGPYDIDVDRRGVWRVMPNGDRVALAPLEPAR